MGRPLAKRYFGNENTNDSGDTVNTFGQLHTGDSAGTMPKSGEGIGGDGVASVTIGVHGVYIDRLPSVSFTAPNYGGIGAVTATGVTHSLAIDPATINTRGSGYQIGDVLTDSNGSTWRVTKLRVVSASLNPTGTNSIWDGTEWIVWDQFINSHWTSPTILKGVTVDGSHHLTGYTAGSSTFGVWDGTDGTPAPTTAQTIVGGPGTGSMTPNYNTRASGDYNGSGVGDNNGAGGSVTFTYGVEAVTLISSIDYVDTGTYNFGSLVTTGGSGNGAAKFTVKYSVNYVEITDPGSGYTSVADISPTFTVQGGGETRATGTGVLTVDSDTTPYIPDAFNSLIVYAQTTDSGSSKIGDIVKQENTRRYKVITADGTAYCNLVTHTPTAIGQVMMIATDSNNATYYVTKLTAHKATLYPYGGGTHLFPLVGDDSDQQQSIHWTLLTSDPSYVADTTVIIENA